MFFEGYYIQAWKNEHRKDKTVKVGMPLNAIRIVEPIHKLISPEVRQEIKETAASLPSDKKEQERFINHHQYRIVVRRYQNDKYALVSGLKHFLILKYARITSCYVFCIEASGREEWLEELKSTYTIKPMVSLDDIEIEEKTLEPQEVMGKIRYLIKNGSFDIPVQAKENGNGKLSIVSGTTNVFAAKQLGLKKIRVVIKPEKHYDDN